MPHSTPDEHTLRSSLIGQSCVSTSYLEKKVNFDFRFFMHSSPSEGDEPKIVNNNNILQTKMINNHHRRFAKDNSLKIVSFLMPMYLNIYCSCQIGLLKMARVVFLILAIQLAEATNCQGENCKTGDFFALNIVQ